MKHFVCILFLFSSLPLAAQFNLGIKTGANLSRINYIAKFDQDIVEQDFVLGYVGGLTFQYFTQPHIGLQLEFLYIQKGFKTKYDTLRELQYERSIDYISMPALMHVYLGKGKFNVSLLLGPYVSYALSSSEIFTEGDLRNKQKYVFDQKRDNRFEFGLQGGIGFRNTFSFGIIELQSCFSFTFTSLYKWGISNEDPDKDRFFPIPEQAQNQGIQVNLSYYRSFGKLPEKK